MTEFEKSALIGMWRQGASFETIADHFGIAEWFAEYIVDEYLKTLNE